MDSHKLLLLMKDIIIIIIILLFNLTSCYAATSKCSLSLWVCCTDHIMDQV